MGGHGRGQRRAHCSFLRYPGSYALDSFGRCARINLNGGFNKASPLAMSSAPTEFAALVAIGLLAASAVPSQAESPPAPPASFTVISPVFGQLVRFSMPTKFIAVAEDTRGEVFFIRAALLKGETVNQLAQMITI